MKEKQLKTNQENFNFIAECERLEKENEGLRGLNKIEINPRQAGKMLKTLTQFKKVLAMSGEGCVVAKNYAIIDRKSLDKLQKENEELKKDYKDHTEVLGDKINDYIEYLKQDRETITKLQRIVDCAKEVIEANTHPRSLDFSETDKQAFWDRLQQAIADLEEK